MNTKNNKRRQASREKIESVFTELLQTKEISQISVSEICKESGLNRSTFYANYIDIYDLADKIRARLEGEVSALYYNDLANHSGNDYLQLFRHIRDHQPLYRMYFKLGYDTAHTINLDLLDQDHRIFPESVMSYHVEFHKAGLNAIIKKWLSCDCQESPEIMAQIIADEYQGRNII